MLDASARRTFCPQPEEDRRELIMTVALPHAFPISSRRRHTRSDRDWSSDVCSSDRSEEHTSELQSRSDLVCRLLLVTRVQTCALPIDRKSTRLNSSHDQISYAVFCLKKKKNVARLVRGPSAGKSNTGCQLGRGRQLLPRDTQAARSAGSLQPDGRYTFRRRLAASEC